MKGVLKTLEKRHRLKEANHFHKSNDIFHCNSTQICYPLNGYWFRISYLQWSRLLGINTDTMHYRVRKGFSTDQILGFKKIPRGSDAIKASKL